MKWPVLILLFAWIVLLACVYSDEDARRLFIRKIIILNSIIIRRKS